MALRRYRRALDLPPPIARDLFGTLFTLFVVPSFYILIAKDHRKEKAKREALEKPPDELVPANGPAPATTPS